MNEVGRLELIRESLVAVVNEMRANVIHSSYSSIIYEGHDFSCALVAGDGRLIAQGVDDNPIHNFAVPYSTAEVVRAFGDDIHEGDIFLHNDPYTGGTHLNDVLMLYPVFHDARLAMFTATRCHWGDVGGMTPGSLSGRVQEIYQEGLRIVPTRICDRGRMNDAWLTLLFDNMRIAPERRGDFNTMLGTSRKAAEHVGRLFARFGGQILLDAVEELIERAETVMRRRIAGIPDGTYHAEGYLDSDGRSATPLRGRLALTVAGERIVADFTGSSPQTRGPTNVGPAMAFNAVASIVKSFLDPDTPVNHGSFNPIQIVNPPGSFLNATLPAPCGGMVECRALMCGLVVSALGRALPGKRVGDLKGGGNHVYVSGPHRDRGGIFLFYEYPAAGTGATGRTDGNHAVRAFPEGDFNAVQSAEVVEAQCPLRIEAHGLREGSCGDGEFRGGLGLRRDVRILGDVASLSVLADKNLIPPFGVAGALSGAANRFTVIRGGKTVEPSPVPGKVGDFPLQIGDVVRMETSGGGGCGDPLARAPERVQADVALGYLDRDQAAERYGVVIDAGGNVDAAATQAMRDRLRASRVRAPVTLANESDLDGPRRRIRLPADLARRLDVRSGALVEIATPACGAALRGWAEIADRADLALSAEALAALGAEAGDTVDVRAVHVAPR
ncbi:MAG: hydantoinase B/oxoprolinase family protein [Chromatiales bacterium]|nr:hydantoinase B/oxoprolinase family protein [Chromatiales bacterium]